MKETTKAMRRRLFVEKEINGFQWKDIFKGKGVDIGSGDDPLPFTGCQPFDISDGDANNILDHLEEGIFDYVHASNVLEHMIDPMQAILGWWKLLKPGGYLIGEVPSWELYEGKRDLSIYNPDHKSTWSMWNLTGGSKLPHYFAPLFFSIFQSGNTNENSKIIKLQLIDTNYDYLKGSSVDQTFKESDEVECFIEFVLKK